MRFSCVAENVSESLKTFICFTSGDISYLAGMEGVCFERNESCREITEEDQKPGREKKKTASRTFSERPQGEPTKEEQLAKLGS